MIDDSSRLGPASTCFAPPGIVAGIGLRQTAEMDEVVSLLDLCLDEAGLSRVDLSALATLDRRASHPALIEAGRLLDLPILALAEAALDRAVPNPSARVWTLTRLPSVAEAAAMAFGPLLVQKRRSASVTCALSHCYAAPLSSAAMTASMLSTSLAGS